MFPPIPLIRKNKILSLLKKHNAYDEKSAKTLEEIGLINPSFFPRITQYMVNRKMIIRTKDNKYYINKD